MAASEYQLSDLIEINSLLGELMDPHDEAEAATNGEGVPWELLEWMQHRLRDGRLRLVQIVSDTDLGVREERLVSPQALAEGTVVDFYDRIGPTNPRRKLYLTAASVAEQWPTLTSVKRWRALAPPASEPVEAPVEKVEQRRLPPLPHAKKEEVSAYLHTLGPLTEDEARAAVAKGLHYHVTRERIRKIDRPKRLPGQRKSAEKSAEK